MRIGMPAMGEMRLYYLSKSPQVGLGIGRVISCRSLFEVGPCFLVLAGVLCVFLPKLGTSGRLQCQIN